MTEILNVTVVARIIGLNPSDLQGSPVVDSRRVATLRKPTRRNPMKSSFSFNIEN